MPYGPVFQYRVTAQMVIAGYSLLPGDVVTIRPLSTVMPFAVMRKVRGEWVVAQSAPRWIDVFREPLERGDLTALSDDAREFLSPPPSASDEHQPIARSQP